MPCHQDHHERFVCTSVTNAAAKDWKVPRITLISLIPWQPILWLFVYFLTVCELWLFPAVTFPICICFPVEKVLGLQRVFAAFYLSGCLLCRFIPWHCSVPFELFRSGLGFCSVPFQTPTIPRLWSVWLGKEGNHHRTPVTVFSACSEQTKRFNAPVWWWPMYKMVMKLQGPD